MAKEDFEQLEQKLKFGTGDERLQAITSMGGLTDADERTRALVTLVPIADSEEARDEPEQVYALLSILQLNEGNFVQRMLPEVYETVRDWWLEYIRRAVQVTDPFSHIMPIWAVSALALAEGDETVTEGLIKTVRCAPGEEIGLVKHCLRAIGAIGHKSGRELLEYWQSKGNVTAQAALEAFGESMEAIEDREKAIKAEKEAEKKTRKEKQPKKKGFFEKLFG